MYTEVRLSLEVNFISSLIRSTLLGIILGSLFVPLVYAKKKGHEQAYIPTTTVSTSFGRKAVSGGRALQSVHGGKIPAGSRPGPSAQPTKKPAWVKISVKTGYSNRYRLGTWLPVRATVRNLTSRTIEGIIRIPGQHVSLGPPYQLSGNAQYRTVYQSPLVLTGGATKHITIYVPAPQQNSNLRVRVLDQGRVIGTAIAYPVAFNGKTISIGALTSDPSTVTWLRHIKMPRRISKSTQLLTPADFDDRAEALASFDVIALDDNATSSLDRAQLEALRTYVEDGGTLVMVGGPGWQEALRSLPSYLVPGKLSGSASVTSLSGLRSLGRTHGLLKHGSATVSVLRKPRGIVEASQGKVPLVVQATMGKGNLLYLAFDPNYTPFSHWQGAESLLGRIVLQAAPTAVSRADSNQYSWSAPVTYGGYSTSTAMGTELDNVPAGSLPPLLLFGGLIVLYIVLLGPVNYFVLSRLCKSWLLWITVPVGATGLMFLTFGVMNQTRNSTVLLNNVGIVTLNGRSGSQPATIYTGLFAPEKGTYQLTAPDGNGLAQMVSQFSTEYGRRTKKPVPIGVQFEEGAETGVDFVGMNMWSMRNAEIKTSVDVDGRLISHLHLTRAGAIAGTVYNGTDLRITHPTLLAGTKFVNLPGLSPGATIHVTIWPAMWGSHISSKIWMHIYGRPHFVYPGTGYRAGIGAVGAYSSPMSVPFATAGSHGFRSFVITRSVSTMSASMAGAGGGDGPIYGYEPSVAAEHDFQDRIRNVVSVMPEAQTITSLGDLVLIGWSQQSLAKVEVNGSVPESRNLNLIVSKLPVSLKEGPFAIRPGTFTPSVIGVVPGRPRPWCCSIANLDVAPHGSATLELTIPATGRIHFNTLDLHMKTSGSYSYRYELWDWSSHRWMAVHTVRPANFTRRSGSRITFDEGVHRPNRFVSSQGRVLLRLADLDSHDLTFADLRSDIRFSGSGTVT